MTNITYLLSHCANCDKALKENEGINGGVVYPEVWCNQECKKEWFLKREVSYRYSNG